MKYSEIPIVNNEELQQYELTIDRIRSFIEYEMRGDTILLTHTEVPPELEGMGVAAALVEKTFTEIEKQGLKLQPYCSYIRAFMKRHPEWKHLQKDNVSD